MMSNRYATHLLRTFAPEADDPESFSNGGRKLIDGGHITISSKH
jgi:hypothetical protein